LKAAEWFRRGRLLIVSPVHGDYRRCQAETPLIVLSKLPRPVQGQENPAFRQMFTSQFIPGANKEQADWFNEFQRISSSPADAARNLLANGEADVSSLLSQVKVPTLVMHARHDARVPFESGRRLAAGIPGARFLPLESRNHVMLEGEPALARFLEELQSFLAADVGH
jgi:pimeloyl-ACP methyl ester carboxylesterase